MLDVIDSEEGDGSINISSWLAKHTILYLIATSINMGLFIFTKKSQVKKRKCYLAFNLLFRNDH